MAEVPKIHGQPGPHEPHKPGRDTPSSEEFKKMMEEEKLKTTEEQKQKKPSYKSEKEKAEERVRQEHISKGKAPLEPSKGTEQPMKGEKKVEKGKEKEGVQPAEEEVEEVSEEQALEQEATEETIPTEPKKEEAPVEEKPTEEIAPTEEAPVEETPVEEAPKQPIEAEKPPEEAMPKETTPQAPMAPTGGVTAPGETPLTAPTPAVQPYAQLSPEMLTLFDRMVGVMTVMNNSGVTETTINLTGPQFTNSPLFGAQVVITEYSTAPRAYNIQILGSPQAIDRLQGKLPILNTAFQKGNLNFLVNRLETSLLPTHRATKKERKKGDEGQEEQ